MLTIYDVMKERLESDCNAMMVIILSGPRAGEKAIYSESGEVLFGEAIEGFVAPEAKMNHLMCIGDVECFVQPVEKDPQVLVLGAGHVSRAITDILLFIGCHVTVVDDRAEYLVPEFFDSRVKRVCLDMTTLRENLPLHVYNGFIVVTRAHEFDNICLNQLRDQLPTYMGVMGSHKRIYYAFENLRLEGWTEEELALIHGPIGLDLGAQTPEEIALSIVSEYLAVTRGREGKKLKESGNNRNKGASA